MPFPAFTGVLNGVGAMATNTGGAHDGVVDPDCGLVTGAAIGLTFEGDEVEYFEQDRTQSCGDWFFGGTLSR